MPFALLCNLHGANFQNIATDNDHAPKVAPPDSDSDYDSDSNIVAAAPRERRISVENVKILTESSTCFHVEATLILTLSVRKVRVEKDLVRL